MKTIAIIGTAGRKEDGLRMSRELFDRMVTFSHIIIKDGFRQERPIQLVSGGAAFADHVEVRLWLSQKETDPTTDMKLKLFLPSHMEPKRMDGQKPKENNHNDNVEIQPTKSNSQEDKISRFPPEEKVHEHERDENTMLVFKENQNHIYSYSNPGKLSNQLHEQFQRRTQVQSFHDFMRAKQLGAEMNTSYPGFYNRNKRVAESDFMIALSWGKSTEYPKDGGTYHTWNLFQAKDCQIHVPLYWLQNQKEESLSWDSFLTFRKQKNIYASKALEKTEKQGVQKVLSWKMKREM